MYPQGFTDGASPRVVLEMELEEGDSSERGPYDLWGVAFRRDEKNSCGAAELSKSKLS